MAQSITITNKAGLKFRFFNGEVPTFAYRLMVKLFKYEIPGGSADDNIVINLGRSRTISFPFKLLFTNTEDSSVGTSTSKTTIQQRFDYLDSEVITNNIEDLYTLDIRSDNLLILNKTCILDSFDIDINSSNPSSIGGTITFTLGGGNQ